MSEFWCNDCMSQIHSVRYKCSTCDDYDCCQRCFTSKFHPQSHKFSRFEMGQESGGIPVQKPKVKLEVSEEDLSKVSEEQLRELSDGLLKEPPVKKARKQTKAELEEAARREFRRLQALAKMTIEERRVALEEEEEMMNSNRVRAYLSRLRASLDDLDRRCLITAGQPNIVLIVFDGFCEVSAATFLLAARAGCRVVRVAVDVTPGVDVGAAAGAVVLRGEGGVTLEADIRFAATSNCGLLAFDALLLPSGRVAALARLRQMPKFASLLRSMAASQRTVAAIGTAPAVLMEPLGLFDSGRRWCGHIPPGYAADSPGHDASAGVVRDGPIMTASSASDALELMRSVVASLTDESTAARRLGVVL